MKKLLKKILITPFIIAIVLLLCEGSLVKKNYAIEDWEVDLSFPTEDVMGQWTRISKYNDNGTLMYPGQWSFTNINGNGYVRNAENTDNLTGFYNPFTNYEDIDVIINMGVQNDTTSDDDFMGIMIRMSQDQKLKIRLVISSCCQEINIFLQDGEMSRTNYTDW